MLGLPVDTSLRNHGASAVIYGGHDAQAMRFDGVAEALAAEGTDVRLFGKPESFVKRRMGVALHVQQRPTRRARERRRAPTRSSRGPVEQPQRRIKPHDWRHRRAQFRAWRSDARSTMPPSARNH